MDPVSGQDTIEVGRFSAAVGEETPPGWSLTPEKTSGRRTEYRLIEDGGTLVVRADSDAASSGLMHMVGIDPREYPVVEWRWKAARLPENSDVRTKTGDDFAARLFLTFETDLESASWLEKVFYGTAKALYGDYPLANAICYVWAGKDRKGTMAANPYTGRVKTVVLRDSETPLGSWASESRDYRDDYLRLFGQEPPMLYSVAIMSDTDNGGGSAQAFFGDILFRKGALSSPRRPAIKSAIYDTISNVMREKPSMTPNIDSKGRLFRLAGGLLLIGIAVALAAAPRPWPVWRTAAVLGLLVGGLFMGFEAARGWCALRACGIRTPF